MREQVCQDAVLGQVQWVWCNEVGCTKQHLQMKNNQSDDMALACKLTPHSLPILSMLCWVQSHLIDTLKKTD